MPRIVGPKTNPIVLLYCSEPNSSSSRKAAKTLLKSNSVHSSSGSISGGDIDWSMIVPRHTGVVFLMYSKYG